MMRTNNVKKILFCRCANRDLVTETDRRRMRRWLRRAGAPVLEVPDLCGVLAADDRRVCDWLRDPGVAVIACHPRAVRSLTAWKNIDLGSENALFNLRETPPDRIAAALGVETDAEVEPEPAPRPSEKPSWEPWFPVIDEQRCHHCGDCRQFCLFDVYERTNDGRVRVTNPTNCKNNCPACARICPHVAIIFPKHPHPPINGAPVEDETHAREAVRVDVSRALGRDPYEMLAARRRTRLLRKKARPRGADNEHGDGTGSDPSESTE